MRADIQKNVRFNFTVNVLDGAFFGLGLGFASYITVIPLFVSTLTDSSVLIGLIAAMHTIGWQLPQLLTANRVARLRRYKPMTILMTLNERVPFFGLVLVALAVPTIGREMALILTFILVIWQAMGGGLTGTAWQSLIAKIMPENWRGRFYGAQSSAANLLSSVGAVIAGVILTRVAAPHNFALCFLLAGLAMILSMGFLNSTREPESVPARETSRTRSEFWRGLVRILHRDVDFRLFVTARSLAQIASIGGAFFTIYAVRHFQMDAATAGVMTGISLLIRTIGDPAFGWLGDRYSHRLMFAVGVLLAGLSAAVALFAPSLEWFYLVFILAGAANSGLWPTVNALTVEFGTPEERPYYIGLANTLVAPVTVLAPIVGGWLADSAGHASVHDALARTLVAPAHLVEPIARLWVDRSTGYQTTFAVAAVIGILTVLMVIGFMREPRARYAEPTYAPGAPYAEPT